MKTTRQPQPWQQGTRPWQPFGIDAVQVRGVNVNFEKGGM